MSPKKPVSITGLYPKALAAHRRDISRLPAAAFTKFHGLIIYSPFVLRYLVAICRMPTTAVKLHPYVEIFDFSGNNTCCNLLDWGTPDNRYYRCLACSVWLCCYRVD